MIDIVAESPALRLLLLTLLFALVVAVAYFAAQAITARQLVRSRMFEGAGATAAAPMSRSLRNERVESSWLRLVNTIEKKLAPDRSSVRLKLTVKFADAAVVLTELALKLRAVMFGGTVSETDDNVRAVGKPAAAMPVVSRISVSPAVSAIKT